MLNFDSKKKITYLLIKLLKLLKVFELFRNEGYIKNYFLTSREEN